MADKPNPKLVDSAVAHAKSLPELIRYFQTVAPDLATAMNGKALIASKSPWGVLLSTGATWAVTHYGLGWDQDTTAMASGGVLMAASYVMRYISSGRITGIIKPTAPPPTEMQTPSTPSEPPAAMRLGP